MPPPASAIRGVKPASVQRVEGWSIALPKALPGILEIASRLGTPRRARFSSGSRRSPPCSSSQPSTPRHPSALRRPRAGWRHPRQIRVEWLDFPAVAPVKNRRGDDQASMAIRTYLPKPCQPDNGCRRRSRARHRDAIFRENKPPMRSKHFWGRLGQPLKHAPNCSCLA